MESLLKELEGSKKTPRLKAAVSDVQGLIDLLVAAREQIARNPNTNTASMTLTKLQNPLKDRFEAVNKDLLNVSKTQKKLGKALDKSMPLRPLPDQYDAMADRTTLIDRAIAMHLLREGEFEVASTFISETQSNPAPGNTMSSTSNPTLGDIDQPMGDVVENGDTTHDPQPRSEPNLPPLHSEELQAKFTDMYRILQDLRSHNLESAIEWAGQNSAALEARGSNFEFELSKLQYIWLFLGPAVNHLPDDDGRNGRSGALAHARANFGRFQARHLREIQQLASAMAFEPNLRDSPYAHVFSSPNTAFSDAAASFTREFCSLLGLSAESPLYVAATAGSLALPRLLKYTEATKMKTKGTAWTSTDELAFETPLPRSMMYHSIFVCPVSKEQTTAENPPMMIPCGHVLAAESVKRLAKPTRFKCPYCPLETNIKEAREIIL